MFQILSITNFLLSLVVFWLNTRLLYNFVQITEMPSFFNGYLRSFSVFPNGDWLIGSESWSSFLWMYTREIFVLFLQMKFIGNISFGWSVSRRRISQALISSLINIFQRVSVKWANRPTSDVSSDRTVQKIFCFINNPW